MNNELYIAMHYYGCNSLIVNSIILINHPLCSRKLQITMYRHEILINIFQVPPRIFIQQLTVINIMTILPVRFLRSSLDLTTTKETNKSSPLDDICHLNVAKFSL